MTEQKDLARVDGTKRSEPNIDAGHNEMTQPTDSDAQVSNQHTPGPWRVRCRVDRGDGLDGTDCYYYIGAGTETWHDNKGHFHPDDARYVMDEVEVVALGYDRDYGTPEGGIRNEADARLIAAAPDLLAACRDIVAFHSSVFVGRPLSIDGEVIDHTLLNEAAHKAEAAIRKAGGKQAV
jgi:hypothetical protein